MPASAILSSQIRSGQSHLFAQIEEEQHAAPRFPAFECQFQKSFSKVAPVAKHSPCNGCASWLAQHCTHSDRRPQPVEKLAQFGLNEAPWPRNPAALMLYKPARCQSIVVAHSPLPSQHGLGTEGKVVDVTRFHPIPSCRVDFSHLADSAQ